MRSRKAFTLFQLLIILAILAMLLALLMPAAAKMRMAATRAQSQNNLKQIAIACHNYLSTFNNSFPPGNDDNNFSAAARLLPFLEQDNLFQHIDFKKSVDDKANAEVRRTRIATFLNPMDTVPAVSSDFGPTNYLFSAGSKPDLVKNDGVFFQDSKVGIQDITDGTSNTLLAVETLKGDSMVKATDMRRQHVLLKKAALKDVNDETGVEDWKNDKQIAADRCASWMDGRFLQGTFTATRTLNDSRPDVNCGGAGGLSGARSLVDGCNIAVCDGSVRFVNVKMKLDTWRIIAGRNDGQPLPNDF